MQSYAQGPSQMLAGWPGLYSEDSNASSQIMAYPHVLQIHPDFSIPSNFCSNPVAERAGSDGPYRSLFAIAATQQLPFDQSGCETENSRLQELDDSWTHLAHQDGQVSLFSPNPLISFLPPSRSSAVLHLKMLKMQGASFLDVRAFTR